MKLDILAFSAHPDDCELSCGGTIINQVKKGRQVGIVDLTKGELGTRGTPASRAVEAANAAKILGISVRENLDLGDGFFENSKKEQLAVISMLRKYQPDIVFANALTDRHPDHGKGAQLLKDAFFLSGLEKVETELNGKTQLKWKPRLLLYYVQSQYIQPDIVVDISNSFEQKMQAIYAYTSQFYNPQYKESGKRQAAETFISSPHFIKLLEARAIEYGNLHGFQYAEGFNMSYTPGVKDITQIF